MMGTRRPMTRAPPVNGRYYDSHGSSNGSTSDSEDSNGSVYTPRADSRNYLLNVRPENRTTFCNIISQLTEETQPTFETTLKPKAVCEGSDAKFVCMLTGYPEPEVTWYKDDEEMDRYCGLPKYEILHNGKRHTLQIYNCSEEDAAIYQASARNNKGIVSCSGVLEVGTMTEYKIHQRWFAKLKRKAEAKMREIEQSRRRVKENFEEGERLRALSPERIQRKRRFSSESKEDASDLSVDTEDVMKVHIPDPNSRLQEDITKTREQPHNVVNGFTVSDTEQKEVTTNGYAVPENIDESGKNFLAYVYETVEVITKKSASPESYAKKKKKEEEPPLHMAESKKDEKVQGSPKKVEGISPAPRRSRFGKDVKHPVEEKMEVQVSPVTSNKRFAPFSAANKIGKTTVPIDAKKPKDSTVSSNKTDDSSKQKQGYPQTKNNATFSLKEMYFGEAMALAEEKETSAFGKDQHFKPEVNGHKVDQTKPIAQVQIKEPPKVAPRRSKEQRDSSIGRKPPPTTNNKPEVSIAKTISKNNQTQPESETKAYMPKSLVENASDSPSFVSEENTKKVELAELISSSNLSPELASKIDNKETSSISGEDGKQTCEPQAIGRNGISSEDTHEDKNRTETLQKLHKLEVEYMALQKAYALLQQQLDISQKKEEEKINEVSDHRSQSPLQKVVHNAKSKDLVIQENTEDKEKPAKCPRSPEIVYMETEESRKEEVVLPVDSAIQGGQLGSMQMTEDVSSLRRQASPVPFMECSSEEPSQGKDDHVVDNKNTNIREKITSELGSGETNNVEVDEDTLKVKESSPELQSSDVEMIEFGKEKIMEDQLNDYKIKTTEDPSNNIFDKSVLENTTAGSSTGTVKTLEKVKAVDKEHVLPLSSEVLPDEQHLVLSDEPLSGKVWDIDLPGEDSSKLSSPMDQNQSVVTLLRDVKKALESDIVSVEETSTHSSFEQPAITLPQTEEDKTDDIPSLSQKKKTYGSVHVASEAKPTTLREKLSDSDLSVGELYGVSHQDSLRNVENNIPKEDRSLVTTLKNSLLMLLHIKTPDTVGQKLDANDKRNLDDDHLESSGNMCSPEISLSPPTPRKIYESGKESDSPLSAESMHSSSTSGKLTPASEEDIAQNVDSLPTSPTIPRRLTEFTKKSGTIAQVESAPLSPVTPKRASKNKYEGTILSKEELSFSPSTSRKIAAKIASSIDISAALQVPSIVVGSLPAEKTLGNILFESQKDSSRKWKSTENLTSIPSATPQELASGARRKIYLPKPKQLDDEEGDLVDSLSPPSRKESPNVSPSLSRRNNSLLASQSPPIERRSPGTSRRTTMLEVPKIYEENVDKEEIPDPSSHGTKDSSVSHKEDAQPTDTKKINDPYKAPQVIRKIRLEQFSDASGNLKLWCQFFNILSDSVITWYKDEVQVAEVKRCSGDEGQVALAIVQASVKDCGVYQCTIQNNYGTDSTDCLLSSEILSGFISKEEVEVGEEIEMTPMVFAKGLADSGYWGDKFFGRIVMEEPHVGLGFLRKACRVKVIYGLEPMFESGKTCIIKIRNLLTFGTKNESTLVEKNYDVTIQECKIQNTSREYCKIFAAECRGTPNFGQFPEILPLNLIYRPANNIPYATIEDDLEGRFEKYCIRDLSGKLYMKNTSEIEQKCCTFQHWVHQWTNGNFLVTSLEGVGWKLTNITIATKSKGYQGLKESCYPEILEEFPMVHQCNSYCDMLGLRSLKATDTLQPPSKPKASRSPQMGRKVGSAQSSPQMQKKSMSSPQSARKGGVSPKSPRKATETGDALSGAKNKGNNESTYTKPQ